METPITNTKTSLFGKEHDLSNMKRICNWPSGDESWRNPDPYCIKPCFGTMLLTGGLPFADRWVPKKSRAPSGNSMWSSLGKLQFLGPSTKSNMNLISPLNPGSIWPILYQHDIQKSKSFLKPPKKPWLEPNRIGQFLWFRRSSLLRWRCSGLRGMTGRWGEGFNGGFNVAFDLF